MDSMRLFLLCTFYAGISRGNMYGEKESAGLKSYRPVSLILKPHLGNRECGTNRGGALECGINVKGRGGRGEKRTGGTLGGGGRQGPSTGELTVLPKADHQSLRGGPTHAWMWTVKSDRSHRKVPRAAGVGRV